MLTLYNGRPENVTERTEVEQSVYDFLDSLSLEYQRLDHEPASTMEICSEIDKSLGAVICKNLFLTNRQKTDFYLLMMPGDKVFKTKELSKELGVSRLSFGDSEKMIELMGTKPGSASVLGLISDKDKLVRLVIDKDVLKSEFFGCHPCVNTSSLRLRVKDLLDVILPKLQIDFTEVTLTGDGA